MFAKLLGQGIASVLSRFFRRTFSWPGGGRVNYGGMNFCLVQGEQYFAAARWEDAISCFEQARSRPQTEAATALLWLGRAYLKAEKWSQAVEVWQEFLNYRPDSLEGWNGKGQALMQLKRYKEAEISFNRALGLKPDDPVTLNNQGTCMLAQKRYKDAYRCLKLALEKAPRDPVLLGNLAFALSKLGSFSEACRYFEMALRGGLCDGDLINNFGVCLAESGQFKAAAELYQRYSFLLDLDNPEVLANVASIFSRSGIYEEALKFYKKALELAPGDFALYNNLGIALEEMGQHEEALENYQKACELCPNNLSVLYNKAVCLEKLKREEEAMQCLDYILRIEPAYSPAWEQKGHLYGKWNDWERAVECYNRAWGLFCNASAEELLFSASLSRQEKADEGVTRA